MEDEHITVDDLLKFISRTKCLYGVIIFAHYSLHFAVAGVSVILEFSFTIQKLPLSFALFVNLEWAWVLPGVVERGRGSGLRT